MKILFEAVGFERIADLLTPDFRKNYMSALLPMLAEQADLLNEKTKVGGAAEHR